MLFLEQAFDIPSVVQVKEGGELLFTRVTLPLGENRWQWCQTTPCSTDIFACGRAESPVGEAGRFGGFGAFG